VLLFTAGTQPRENHAWNRAVGSGISLVSSLCASAPEPEGSKESHRPVIV